MVSIRERDYHVDFVEKLETKDAYEMGWLVSVFFFFPKSRRVRVQIRSFLASELMSFHSVRMPSPTTWNATALPVPGP